MRNPEQHGETLDQVLEIAVLINDDMTQSLARDGLTAPRAHLLWVLHHRGPSTQRVLAEALGVSPRNITGLVDGLVATGFVTREPHPTDRRATLVTVTEIGARTANEMEAGRGQLAEQLFSGMSDKQFAGLGEGLGALLDRLRQLVSDAKGTS